MSETYSYQWFNVSPPIPIVPVQSAETIATSSSTTLQVVLANVGAGHLLTLSSTEYEQVAILTVQGGGTWAKAADDTASSSAGRNALWYCLDAVGGTTTVVVNLAAAPVDDHFICLVTEWPATGATLATGAAATNGSGATVTSPSLTPAIGELVIAVGSGYAAPLGSPSTNWTALSPAGSNYDPHFQASEVAYMVTTSTTPVSCAWGQQTAATWQSIIVGFAVPSAAGRTAIPGATGSTYKLQASDDGQQIEVGVSRSDATAAAYSAATAMVAGAQSTPGAGVTVVFPADAGHIDVTRHGADKTGVVDCTSILQNLIGANLGNNGIPCVLYFPAGTYLISKSLVAQTTSGLWYPDLTLRGENVNTTTIKMKDGVWTGASNYSGSYPTNAGFANSATVENSMLVTGTYGATSGNNAFNNYIYDLTWDLGDNPGGGCIGYLVNNVGAIRRCNFKCTAGFIGVDLGRGITGPGLISDCNFSGPFAMPWISYGQDYSFIMERCNVLTDSPGGYSGYQGFVMGLKDCNFVQPVRSLSAAADTTLWNSPGIKTESALGGRIQYLAPGKGGFKIPSVDTPLTAYDPVSDWVNAATYPGGVQAAMNSGKSTVYFPATTNVGINPTITVPSTVNRVISMGYGPTPSSWNQSLPFFETTGSSATPLTFEWNSQQPGHGGDSSGTANDQNTYTYVKHSSTRDLVMMDWSGTGIIQGTTGGGRIFFDNVFLRCNLGPGNELYARQINWEDPFVTCISNAGGRAWIFGLKTEWPCAVPGNWPSFPCGNFQPTILGTAGGRTDMCVGFSLPNTGVPATLTQYDFINASYGLSWIDFQTVPINWTVDVSSSPAGTITSVPNPNTRGTRGTAYLSYQGG